MLIVYSDFNVPTLHTTTGGVYGSIRMPICSPDACRAVGIAAESDEEKSRHFASRL